MVPFVRSVVFQDTMSPERKLGVEQRIDARAATFDDEPYPEGESGNPSAASSRRGGIRMRMAKRESLNGPAESSTGRGGVAQRVAARAAAALISDSDSEPKPYTKNFGKPGQRVASRQMRFCKTPPTQLRRAPQGWDPLRGKPWMQRVTSERKTPIGTSAGPSAGLKQLPN